MSDKTDDDQGYFIPGIYMMSDKEAIEAGFISYDKPIAQHNNPIAQSDGSSRNSDNVEKLCNDLTHWSYNYSLNNPMQSVAIFHETIAMLRALAAERDEQYRESETFTEEIKALRAEKATSGEGLLRWRGAFTFPEDDDEPSPAIGDVEKLIERLEQGIDVFDPDKGIPEAEKVMDEAAAMLRSLASDDDVATGTIATLRDEIGALRTTLDNMTEEYHHIRAEKESLTSTVNDMATMVNEARAKLAQADAGERYYRAKLEKAREGLTLIVTPQCELNSSGAIAYQLIQIARATLEEISPFPEA